MLYTLDLMPGVRLELVDLLGIHMLLLVSDPLIYLWAFLVCLAFDLGRQDALYNCDASLRWQGIRQGIRQGILVE